MKSAAEMQHSAKYMSGYAQMLTKTLSPSLIQRTKCLKNVMAELPDFIDEFIADPLLIG
jgi:hypothetical protein